MHRPWARFDDLAAGTALLCPPPSRVLAAVRPDEVAGVIAGGARRRPAGSWAFGYVAYEAAAGLDPAAAGRPVRARRACRWSGSGCATSRRGSTPWPSGRRPAPDDAAGSRTGPTTSTPGPSPACGSTSPPATPTSATSPTGCARPSAAIPRGALRAPRPRPARRLQRLPRPRPARRRQRQPRAVLRVGRRRAADPADEGHGRRAGATTAEDREQAALLRASAKERAENLMIVDLLRNDLGRVARDGQRAGRRALRPRALPDRLADDLAGQRADSGPARAARPVPGAVPLRIGHRRAQARAPCS